MKKICDDKKCTGCLACLNICPRNCITVGYNERKELVPKIGDNCINCQACVHICPSNNNVRKYSSNECYAVYSKSNRELSSSGGVATELALQIISSGGSVCGAVLSDCVVKHIVTNDISKTDNMRGSKYVQSNIGNCYREIKNLIKAGNEVLFIGTPCQVAGIKAVVGENERLYCIDLICHGTPSPLYLEEIIKSSCWNTDNISFRNKGEFVLSADGKASKISERYMLSFLSGLTFRESCYQCDYAQNQRVGDITLGDFWEIRNFPETEKGVSLVLINNEKGKKLFETIEKNVFYEKRTLSEAYAGNAQLNHPSVPHHNRKKFIQNIIEKKSFDDSLKHLIIRERIKNWLKKRKFVQKLLKIRGKME